MFFHAAGQKGKDGPSKERERENQRTLKYYNDCSASAPKLCTPNISISEPYFYICHCAIGMIFFKLCIIKYLNLQCKFLCALIFKTQDALKLLQSTQFKIGEL